MKTKGSVDMSEEEYQGTSVQVSLEHRGSALGRRRYPALLVSCEQVTKT